MIVRHFLRWVQTASAADRADATSALARAYLHGDLGPDDRDAAEAALLVLVDDPSPLVRLALADALGHSEDAPSTVIAALLNDQPEIAATVAGRSPLLLDAELVDLVGGGQPQVQFAVACRDDLPVPVAAAIAEVGCYEAALAVAARVARTLPGFTLARLVERFGDRADLREALIARPELDPGTRQALTMKLAGALACFVSEMEWLPADRAERVAREACEKATITIAADVSLGRIGSLVRHLRSSGQLTTGLVLRALLSGQMALFEAALADLSGLPIRQVSGLVHDRRGAAFRMLYERANLPPSAWTAFRAALDAFHEEGGASGLRAGEGALRRRMVERVLTAYVPLASGELDQLMVLLRRFALEAARDEARAFTQDLVAGQDAIADEDLEFPVAAVA